MEKIIDEKEALLRLANICAKQEKSPNDILKKLNSWGFKYDEAKIILVKLQNNDLTNNLRFAKAFVHDKLHFNKWGKRKLAFMLSQKGIPQNIITSALDSIEFNDYEKIISEELSKKQKNLKGNSPRETEIKLLKFAESRGYEFDICKKILNNKCKLFDY